MIDFPLFCHFVVVSMTTDHLRSFITIPNTLIAENILYTIVDPMSSILQVFPDMFMDHSCYIVIKYILYGSNDRHAYC